MAKRKPVVRARSKRTYAVLEQVEGGFAATGGIPLESLRECKQWIKERGLDGRTYQPTLLLGSPIRVEIQHVRRAALQEVTEVEPTLPTEVEDGE